MLFHCLSSLLKEEYPGIFFSIFRDWDCKPTEGYFVVYFYKKEENGEISKRIVFVDDYIPYVKFPDFCLPLFSHYNSDPLFNKFMVGKYLLIEKAYAQFKGCYKNIEGNISDTAIFFDLTGVDKEIIFLSDNLFYNHSSKININISQEEFRNPAIKIKMIENKKLDKETKNKIFNKIKTYLNDNLVNIGTEDKSIYGEINDFGIFAKHRYDLLKVEKN